jgi:hypothetical protein
MDTRYGQTFVAKFSVQGHAELKGKINPRETFVIIQKDPALLPDNNAIVMSGKGVHTA